MNFELNSNQPNLNWDLSLLIAVIILLFILFNYGIILNNRIPKVNTGEFIKPNE